MEDEDDEVEAEQLGEAVKLPAAKKVVPKGSQHPRGKTGLPHCTPDGMGQVPPPLPLCLASISSNSQRTALRKTKSIKQTLK